MLRWISKFDPKTKMEIDFGVGNDDAPAFNLLN